MAQEASREGESQIPHPLIQLRARDVMPPPVTFAAHHDPIGAFTHRPVEQLVDGLRRSSSIHLYHPLCCAPDKLG